MLGPTPGGAPARTGREIHGHDALPLAHGPRTLRLAGPSPRSWACAARGRPRPAPRGPPARPAAGCRPAARPLGALLRAGAAPAAGARPRRPAPDRSDRDLAVSSEADEAEAGRLIALVELARNGDAEAFGLLYDHYQAVGLPLPLLPRRLGRARRGPHLGDVLPGAAQHELLPLAGQGLRRLADDHRPQPHHRPLQVRAAPASRCTTEDMTPHDSATEGPETAVLASLTNEALLAALSSCPPSSRSA